LQKYLKKILYPLRQEDRKQLIIIFFLSIFGAIFELIGIGLIIPILNIFVGNEYEHYFKHIIFLNNFSKEGILILSLIILTLVYFFKFFLLRFLIKKSNSFSHMLYVNISKKLFSKYLKSKYIFHLNNNSSKLIRNITSEANMFSFGVVFFLVRFFTELLVFVSICSVLLFFDFKSSILIIFLFLTIGIYILKRTAAKMKKLGKIRQFHSSYTLKQLQQSLASIKEVLINNLEEVFLKKYLFHNLEHAKVSIKRDTIVQMPRLILELIGVSSFTLLIIFLISADKDVSQIFVIVGVFFFAAVRLLPSVSKIVQSIQSVKYNSVVIDLIYNELSQNNDFVNFKTQNSFKNFKIEKIKLKNVCFSYPESNEDIIRNVELIIKKGDTIGLTGKTGSGKSTFINILLGLLEVKSGTIELNNEKISKNITNLQNNVGYVPQNVSVIDESVAFNITLESDASKIDKIKLDKVLKIVDLYDHVYSFNENVDYFVGEKGNKLSGGQCQRLGIARAIYRDPEILILDEATNSLDESTENKILNQLFENYLNITIISISHKKTSLVKFKRILKVENREIKEMSKNEFIGS